MQVNTIDCSRCYTTMDTEQAISYEDTHVCKSCSDNIKDELDEQQAHNEFLDKDAMSQVTFMTDNLDADDMY